MAEHVQDAEIVEEGTELAVRQDAPLNLFGSHDPEAVIERATKHANALAGVIEAKQLFSNIQGKRHVRVQGWTLLGSMVGVFPVTVWTKPVENGWAARVEARTLSGAIVGAAESQCLKSESNWRTRDDYALQAMAQTRATSRALRQPLDFIVTLAGFDATPAEEAQDWSAGDSWGEADQGPVCPRCGSGVWDNRDNKRNPKAPDFKCKNKAKCDWASWNPHEFENQAGSVPAATPSGASTEPQAVTAPAASPPSTVEDGGSQPGPSSSGGSDEDEKNRLLDLIDQAVTAEVSIKSRKSNALRKATAPAFVITARELASADPERYGDVPVPTTEDTAGQFWVLHNCSLPLIRALVDYTDLERVVNGAKQKTLESA